MQIAKKMLDIKLISTVHVMFVIKVILRFEMYGPALSGLKLLDVLVVSLSVLMSSAVF